MTLALWCVLVAAILPYAATGIAKGAGRMSVRANHHPREWLEALAGLPKRAHWAQLNGFEVFPAFAAAVVICQMLHAVQSRVDALASAFIVFRLAYLLCYLADWARLRTLVWFGGTVCTVWLFLLNA